MWAEKYVPKYIAVRNSSYNVLWQWKQFPQDEML